MAKIYEVSEETMNLFLKKLGETGQQNYFTIDVVGKEMKNDIYKVAKANDYVQDKMKIDVIIMLDEEIFDTLGEDDKNLIVTEALCGLVYNPEKDALTLEKPDIQTFGGILEKFTNEAVLRVKTLINLALKQRADLKADKKAEGKTKKLN